MTISFGPLDGGRSPLEPLPNVDGAWPEDFNEFSLSYPRPDIESAYCGFTVSGSVEPYYIDLLNNSPDDSDRGMTFPTNPDGGYFVRINTQVPSQTVPSFYFPYGMADYSHPASSHVYATNHNDRFVFNAGATGRYYVDGRDGTDTVIIEQAGVEVTRNGRSVEFVGPSIHIDVYDVETVFVQNADGSSTEYRIRQDGESTRVFRVVDGREVELRFGPDGQVLDGDSRTLLSPAPEGDQQVAYAPPELSPAPPEHSA